MKALRQFSVLISIFFCFGGSCEVPLLDTFYSVDIKNNTSDTINVFLADNHSSVHYPDTTLPTKRPALFDIPPRQIRSFDSRTRWEEIIKGLPRDTLSVYFIDGKVYDTVPWDSIRVHYKILERRDFSLEELQKLDFRISYP